MKTYRWHLVALALIILLVHSMAYQDELDKECFTDSCLCVDDCLKPLEED